MMGVDTDNTHLTWSTAPSCHLDIIYCPLTRDQSISCTVITLFPSHHQDHAIAYTIHTVHNLTDMYGDRFGRSY